jgi:hypothetical protein
MKNPQIAKKIVSANRKTQSATIAERPQIYFIISVCSFADLHFAELICGPPTFGDKQTRETNRVRKSEEKHYI